MKKSLQNSKQLNITFEGVLDWLSHKENRLEFYKAYISNYYQDCVEVYCLNNPDETQGFISVKWGKYPNYQLKAHYLKIYTALSLANYEYNISKQDLKDIDKHYGKRLKDWCLERLEKYNPEKPNLTSIMQELLLRGFRHYRDNKHYSGGKPEFWYINGIYHVSPLQYPAKLWSEEKAEKVSRRVGIPGFVFIVAPPVAK